MMELKEIQREFKEALLSVNRIAAGNIIAKSGSDKDSLNIVEKLIVPVLQEIGDGWEKGDISLAQVYMSSRICEELVNEVFSSSPPPKKKLPKAAIAVLEDNHLLGKRIIYSALKASGFEILDLGGGLSADEIVERVEKEKIEILLISVLMLSSALHIKEMIEKMHVKGIKPIIVVGGAPFLFDEKLRGEIGADFAGKNSKEAIEIVTKLSEGAK